MRQTVRRLLRLTQVLLISYFFSPRVCHILEHFACPPSLPIQCGVVYGTAGLFFGPRDFTPHSEPVILEKSGLFFGPRDFTPHSEPVILEKFGLFPQTKKQSFFTCFSLLTLGLVALADLSVFSAWKHPGDTSRGCAFLSESMPHHSVRFLRRQ